MSMTERGHDVVPSALAPPPATEPPWPPGVTGQPPRRAPEPAESAIRVLPAVRAYIDGLGTLTGVKAPLAALAVWNARALENCRPDAPEAAKARLAQELRATLMSLTTEQTHDPDRLDRFLDEMGTPADLPAEVRDTPDSEPADVGSEGRGDRPSAR